MKGILFRLHCRLVYLQSFTHASADDQQVYPLLQHLLQICRLYSWVMLRKAKYCVSCYKENHSMLQ